MPYVISWPQTTFLAEFEGTVTADEIEAVNHAFSGDERMEKFRYSVWDFSLASSVDMPEHEIEYAAAFDKGVSIVSEVTRPLAARRVNETRAASPAMTEGNAVTGKTG